MLIIDLKTGESGCDIALERLCMALGSFDGVHLGHMRVISSAVGAARERGCKSAVWCVTSEAKRSSFGSFITSEGEKKRIFASLFADYAIFEDFETVKDLSPAEFVNTYLKKLGCVCVSTGFNFRFGKGASGDSSALCELCQWAGIDCVVSPPVKKGETVVSSTTVRALIESGDAEGAAQLLGRNFFITAKVAHGRTLGKKLGFPTINQYFDEGKIIPKHGVYFALAEIGGVKYPSVSNVGSRPTVGGHVCRAETHILDFEGDLYGKEITVEFVKFRREEVRFNSEDELTEAVRRDAEAAGAFFKAQNQNSYTNAENK